MAGAIGLRNDGLCFDRRWLEQWGLRNDGLCFDRGWLEQWGCVMMDCALIGGGWNNGV